MNRTTCLAVFFLSCLLLLPAAGCGGSGPQLGEVTGTVTLDGKPLPNAEIVFQPGPGGSPSSGTTDEEGHYELMYALGKPGAMVGRHVVRITTERMDRGDPTPENPDGELISYPERLPPRYHAESELEREVKSGSQKIPFNLKSK